MNDPVMPMPSSPEPESRVRRLTPGRVGAVLGLVLIALAVFAVTVIESGQSAVLIRAGSDQARVITAPGVYLRVPFIERVWLIDTRLKTTEQLESASCTTADQKTVNFSAWMAWRVTDPIRFQAATSAEKGLLDDRLRKTLADGAAMWVGAYPAAALLKGQADTMTSAALTDLNQRLSSLGVEAMQAGLRQVGLSEAENAVVYARMSAAKNRSTRQLIEGLSADERQLVALQTRQQAQILVDAARAAQQARQHAEQQLLAAYDRQYGQPNGFAETLRNPPPPAGKSEH